jgi:hypothetical protein
MDIDLSALPDDVESLQQWVRSLAAERTSLSEAQAEIERLHLINEKLQRSQFGRRAERLDDDQLQPFRCWFGVALTRGSVASVRASSTSRSSSRGFKSSDLHGPVDP